MFKGGAAKRKVAPPLPSSLQLWRSFHEICAFCFFLILASALTGHGARYAVIIGIADYPREENDLSYTVNDATAVAKVLLKDKAWDEGNVIVLLNEEATKGAVADVLSLLADKASMHDLLFFYFSGHGTAAPDTPPYDEHDSYDEYICTYGTSFEEFIRDDELSAWLASIPVGTLVVALDACYSGGQIRTSIGRVKALSAYYYPMKGDGFAVDLKRLRLRLKDLGDLDREVVILTSSAENELSWELGPPFSHGLFTYYFLEAMRGKADIEGNEDGIVSAEECFFYLSPRVREISRLYGLNQNPQLFDNYQGEAVLINRYSMLCEKWETVLKPGWHMISLPGEICGPNDPDTVLGDDVSPLYLFHYEPELGRYSMYPPAGEISLVPGKSYWIHLSEMTILDAELRQISGDEFVTVVSSGWNMIGNPFPFDVALSKLKVRHGEEELSLIDAQNRQWVSAYLFGYDPIREGYVVLNPQESVLETWHGYWMRAYVDCALVFPTEPAQMPQQVEMLDIKQLEVLSLDLPPVSPSSSRVADRLWVVLIPNPVRDVNTAVFQVLGICPCRVQGIRVEIYDLAGRLVWRGEDEGSILTWHTKGLDGMPLANGVYLYKAYVKVENEWVPVGVQKVAVYR